MKLLYKLYRLLFPVKQLVWERRYLDCTWYRIVKVGKVYKLDVGDNNPKYRSTYLQAVEKLNEFNNNK